MSIKDLKEDIMKFINNKVYLVVLILTVVGCYGFKMMHVTIGIDDTPYEYYFSEGLVVIVGRWVLFLLNKIISIANFAPFLTEFAAVLLFMLAVTCWSIVFKRIFGKSIPEWGYVVFACLFISNPLISEVFTYFLHNGICIGYTFSALSLLAFLEGLDKRGKEKSKSYGVSALCIWVAIGCYESFAVVFMVALLLVLFSRRICYKKDHVILSVLSGVGILVAAIALRSIITKILIAVFSLEGMKDEAVGRSVSEMLSWIVDAEGRAGLTMAIKRAIVMYGVFAYQYLPILMYVLACIALIICAVVFVIKRKDPMIFLYMIGIFVASWILIFVEGKVTLYRACQFIPLFCAYGFLLLIYGCRSLFFKYKKLAIIGMIIALIAIMNQVTDMNKWFAIDYQKYELAKDTMNQVAYELERSCDITKPLIFVGVYDIPMEIIQDAYVPIGSELFWKMNRITSKIDEHLLEKFYRRGNIWVAQTPSLSVIQWGMSAFDGNKELIKFMKMHGHEFVATEDIAFIQQVTMENLDMPVWPRDGSIKEYEDYIVINFGF